MATVISNEKLVQHNVDKYTFKVLAMGPSSNANVQKSSLEKVEEKELEKPQTSVDSSSISTNSKDSLIESLMKKTDEMSSNFIKLQMKLESMSQDHKKEIEKVKEESFQEGIVEGKEQALKEEKGSIKNSLEQFVNSIKTLENSASEYEKALEGIKSELISAAIDISKEVINVELSKNSSEIAEVLSRELIKDLQGASKIKLKVNPKNHGDLSKNLGSLEHVEIVSDGAVSEGGVIAISDAGNIDAQISKRFERVKRAALSE
ncbi:MAG: FliH/SctL family protein [Sulfurimonas sp.]|uniref:flagellar assembly protein FliH n=1 Tax=Sulfurimonas sp. TaxID=2022749 RepID=UPI0025F02BE6|nr:flagellar assembly protein FliH [Sulfurimonas sp.]MCK9491658.1 FliH/SctL family protein [Sulfurimonas sp.]